MVPSATLKTKDGRYVIIGGNGDSVYSRLMAAVGRPDMGAENPLYANNSERCKREDEIYEVGIVLVRNLTMCHVGNVCSNVVDDYRGQC